MKASSPLFSGRTFLGLWRGIGLGGIRRARAWSTRLSLALPPVFIPADFTEPTETFHPFQSGALLKTCAFPTIFQAFMNFPPKLNGPTRALRML